MHLKAYCAALIALESRSNAIIIVKLLQGTYSVPKLILSVKSVIWNELSGNNKRPINNPNAYSNCFGFNDSWLIPIEQP